MQAPAASPAVEALARATEGFLRRHPPFDGMEEPALRYLASRLAIGYFAAGSTVLDPQQGEASFLYIVRSGLVRVLPGTGAGAGPGAEYTLGPGESFSVGALLERRATTAVYSAVEDTFCLQLEARCFHELLELSPRFREFSTRYLVSLLRESRRLLTMHAASLVAEQQAMGRTLRSLIGRPPVSCPPDLPTGQALRLMHEHGIGSIVVAGPDGAPAGILTRHDVLGRVALAGCRLEDPVCTVMTPAPRTLGAEASAYDAALLIARHGVRHVPVVDAGRLIGVVTERDLFALQRVGIRSIHRAIAAAPDIGALRQAASDIRSLARSLAREGASAEPLVLIISTLNDALTGRILELAGADCDLEGITWGWLGFGSEGRFEQTVSTDQDNGLIFEVRAGDDLEAARHRLLAFAGAVNQSLDECGFPLCRGRIMAGNPHWCLTAAEWQQQFFDWIDQASGQALLHAVIFFDFRLLHGRDELAAVLRRRLLARCAATPRFLRQLAEQALSVRPPLGLISDFTTERGPDGAQLLDLKKSAARLFVDAARVLALAHGVAHTSTAERLRQAGARSGVRHEETDAAVEALFYIQMLRLRRQSALPDGTQPELANRIDPRTLNEVDRRMLKECLRQARKLQARLAVDYQL